MKNVMSKSMLNVVYTFVVFMMAITACLIATNTLSPQSIATAMVMIVMIVGVIVMEVIHSRKSHPAM